MHSEITVRLILLFVFWPQFTVVTPIRIWAQGPPQTKTFDSNFRLLRRSNRFSLQYAYRGATNQIVIPRAWLITPKEKSDQGSKAFVSSFNYNRQVQSFPIGD